jgi:hypothetical protein
MGLNQRQLHCELKTEELITEHTWADRDYYLETFRHVSTVAARRYRDPCSTLQN